MKTKAKKPISLSFRDRKRLTRLLKREKVALLADPVTIGGIIQVSVGAGHAPMVKLLAEEAGVRTALKIQET